MLEEARRRPVMTRANTAAYRVRCSARGAVFMARIIVVATATMVKVVNTRFKAIDWPHKASEHPGTQATVLRTAGQIPPLVLQITRQKQSY